MYQTASPFSRIQIIPQFSIDLYSEKVLSRAFKGRYLGFKTYILRYLTVYQDYSYVSIHYTLFVKKNNDQCIKNKVYHQYITRNYDGLETKSHRTSLFETSPYYSCVKIFNHLSNDIKNLPLTTFKRKLRSYLIEKCFYNLDEFFNNN